jgi:hypothetical protein
VLCTTFTGALPGGVGGAGGDAAADGEAPGVGGAETACSDALAVAWPGGGVGGGGGTAAAPNNPGDALGDDGSGSGADSAE